MKFSFKKAIISGILALTTLTATLVAAAPVAAASSGMTLESKSVSNTATGFTVNLSISSQVAIAGAQSYITYDSNKLNLTGVAYNSSPKLFGSTQFNIDPGIATAGQINGMISTTQGGVTVTPNGVWATLTFDVLPGGANSMTTIHMVPTIGGFGSFVMNTAGDALATDHTDGVITIGQPVFPDLVVSAASTTPANGSTLAYNLNFTVTNNGSGPSVAAQAAYTIGGNTTTVTENALLVGASQNFVIPLAVTALVPSTGTINVIADYNNANQELNENNNTATTSYTALPDLTIAGSTTSSTHDASYVLHFTVTNGGPTGAAASTATYNDGTGAVNVAITALAAGATETHDINMTAHGLVTTIILVADATGAVTESNEANNTNTTGYQYAPANAGTTGVSGTLLEQFQFTVPTDVNWNQSTQQLLPVIDPQLNYGANTADRNMTIKSNKKWNVTIAANSDVAGAPQGPAYLTKYATGGAYDPNVHLADPLVISTTGEQVVTISKTAQILADGVAADLANQGSYQGGTITGITRVAPVHFAQTVEYQDAALANPAYYHMVVTFTCNVSDY